MRSLRTLAVIPAFALVAATLPAQQSELGSAKIAIIDMLAVYQGSKMGKDFEARKQTIAEGYNTTATKKQEELARLETELRQLQEDLQKQRNVLSPEGIEKKQSEIRVKERDYKAFGEDAQIELQRSQERARQMAQGLDQEFQQKIQPIIRQVAEELKIDILIDSQTALSITDGFDVSQRIIEKADAATPAASSAPAPPPEGQP
jgi:Skp family chaperone for outer membrane proteins